MISVLTEEGITLRTGATVEAIETSAVQIVGQDPVPADAVLVSTGRRPATDGLNLAAAGVATGEGGAVVVDDQLRTSADGVFALGDVHGGAQQTYLSLDDHRVVLSAVAGDGSRRVSDRVGVPSTMFLTPPLSSVGLTEAQAREAGHSVRTAVAQVAAIKAMPRPKTLRDGIWTHPSSTEALNEVLGQLT